MNRQISEKFRDSHLRQKYNLVHLLPSLDAPALSGLYLKSFLNATKKYRLQLPQQIIESDGKFCGMCGSVRIPFRNTKMHIEGPCEGLDNGHRRNLIYTCLQCGQISKFPLNSTTAIQNESSKSSREPQEFTATWPRNIENHNNGVSKKNTAKDRAKKRKANTLSSMLAKKTDSQKKKTLSSLDLESFMEHG